MSDTHPFEGPRGLRGYTRFVDTYDAVVEVQESSAVAVVDGFGSFINVTGGPGQNCWLRIQGKDSSASAHLDKEMAKELILALAEFVGAPDA